MEERRTARIGTVSGLALLTGGTAVAAVAGVHTIFATVLLGLLTLGLGHALLVEIRRQAHRGGREGWSRHDTINAFLLGLWSETSLIATILGDGSTQVRAVGLLLSLAYAAACGYFVTERRRAVAGRAVPAPAHSAASTPPATNAAVPVHAAAPTPLAAPAAAHTHSAAPTPPATPAAAHAHGAAPTPPATPAAAHAHGAAPTSPAAPASEADRRAEVARVSR